MSTVALFVELEIAPGRKGDFLARAREHRINVLNNEPGCQRFDLLSPQEGSAPSFSTKSTPTRMPWRRTSTPAI